MNPAKLKTVYIVGHSRGGVVALRLARKFKENFPNAIVTVDAFDPVARVRNSYSNPDRDMLGMDEENGTIDNPTVDYPRQWWNNDNVGNWAWKTDLRRQFGNKHYFTVSNYINGGKMPHWLNLPFDTRALTHESGEQRFLDLGWLYQEWFPVASNGAGHVEIVRDVSMIDLALMRLKEKLDLHTRNIAPSAFISTSSTLCDDGYCRSAYKVNDTDLDSRPGMATGWAAATTASSEWLQLSWPAAVHANHVEIISGENSELTDMELQYHDGSQRVTIQPRSISSIGVKRSISFDTVSTTALRLAGFSGSSASSRLQINEILVRRAEQPTVNLALNAIATGSTTYPGYSAAKANDGSTSTAPGGEHSWANADYVESPHWLELTWNTPILTRHLEVFSTDGYALQGFDVQYFVNGDWTPVPARSSSTTGSHTCVTFNPVTTYRIRLTNFVGPVIQPGYFRVNEIVVHGAQ